MSNSPFFSDGTRLIIGCILSTKINGVDLSNLLWIRRGAGNSAVHEHFMLSTSSNTQMLDGCIGATKRSPMFTNVGEA